MASKIHDGGLAHASSHFARGALRTLPTDATLAVKLDGKDLANGHAERWEKR
jgi:hypothetical protein